MIYIGISTVTPTKSIWPIFSKRKKKFLHIWKFFFQPFHLWIFYKKWTLFELMIDINFGEVFSSFHKDIFLKSSLFNDQLLHGWLFNAPQKITFLVLLVYMSVYNQNSEKCFSNEQSTKKTMKTNVIIYRPEVIKYNTKKFLYMNWRVCMINWMNFRYLKIIVLQ